jgi:hypothetical protein
MYTHPGAAAHHCIMVERLANMAGISLRSGCHCNPGAREVALGYSTKEMAVAFKDKDRLRYEQFLHLIDGKTTGGRRGSRAGRPPPSPMSTGSGNSPEASATSRPTRCKPEPPGRLT